MSLEITAKLNCTRCDASKSFDLGRYYNETSSVFTIMLFFQGFHRIKFGWICNKCYDDWDSLTKKISLERTFAFIEGKKEPPLVSLEDWIKSYKPSP